MCKRQYLGLGNAYQDCFHRQSRNLSSQKINLNFYRLNNKKFLKYKVFEHKYYKFDIFNTLWYADNGGDDLMLRSESKLHNRDLYLRRLIAFQDTEPVKIITGIRRCGKSSLMKLMVRHLRKSGITAEQIIEINFESMEFRGMSVEELYCYVKERRPANKRVYLFFDEIQRINEWQDAVNSFRVDFDCDIYVTGSNAYLLSSEYATYLAGRSVEIKMFPLSFREFLDFHGYTVRETESPGGGYAGASTTWRGKITSQRNF